VKSIVGLVLMIYFESMKITLAVISVLILVILDFLALQDIINNDEPDLTAEYGILVISIIAAIGIFISFRFGKKE